MFVWHGFLLKFYSIFGNSLKISCSWQYYNVTWPFVKIYKKKCIGWFDIHAIPCVGIQFTLQLVQLKSLLIRPKVTGDLSFHIEKRQGKFTCFIFYIYWKTFISTQIKDMVLEWMMLAALLFWALQVLTNLHKLYIAHLSVCVLFCSQVHVSLCSHIIIS